MRGVIGTIFGSNFVEAVRILRVILLPLVETKLLLLDTTVMIDNGKRGKSLWNYWVLIKMAIS